MTPDEIAEAKVMQEANATWKAMGQHFGVSPETVRRALDPDWAIRRRAQINERRLIHRIAEERSEGRPPQVGHRERSIDTSAAILINDCPETLTGAMMGDPSPERLRLVHGERF